ncbi:hypothetical protein [Collinsella ihumii]|uniref:Uncharacterized protein n=1 Tax=Collinsella ihumii TaxID=1720204 RepID=A0AAW7JSY7_9ACTN|nr:hypothetical protein [Collinsella ihumii]MDN0070300.1 hypothetical protein [Collinsella ihumii]
MKSAASHAPYVQRPAASTGTSTTVNTRRAQKDSREPEAMTAYLWSMLLRAPGSLEQMENA